MTTLRLFAIDRESRYWLEFSTICYVVFVVGWQILARTDSWSENSVDTSSRRLF
jgi:hypothetical protein